MDNIFEDVVDNVKDLSKGNGKYLVITAIVAVVIIGYVVSRKGGSSSTVVDNANNSPVMASTGKGLSQGELNGAISGAMQNIQNNTQQAIDALAKKQQESQDMQAQTFVQGLQTGIGNLTDKINILSERDSQLRNDFTDRISGLKTEYEGKIQELKNNSYDIRKNVVATNEDVVVRSSTPSQIDFYGGQAFVDGKRREDLDSKYIKPSWDKSVNYQDGYVDSDGGVRNNMVWTGGGVMNGKSI